MRRIFVNYYFNYYFNNGPEASIIVWTIDGQLLNLQKQKQHQCKS